MATPEIKILTFPDIYAKSIPIINSRYFRILSLVFFLPLSLSLSFYLSTTTTTHRIAAVTLISLLYICSVATVTHGTYHTFYGTSVDLNSTMASLWNSFFPLLITTIPALIIAYSISSLFAMVINSLPIDFDHSFIVFLFTTVVVLPLISIQVQFAAAVEIEESKSKSGLETLLVTAKNLVRRGSILKPPWWKEMGRFLVISWCFEYMLWGAPVLWSKYYWIWGSVMLTFIINSIAPYYLSVNTLLYMYFKALNGELEGFGFGIAEESGGGIAEDSGGDDEYVRLPIDGDEDDDGDQKS